MLLLVIIVCVPLPSVLFLLFLVSFFHLLLICFAFSCCWDLLVALGALLGALGPLLGALGPLLGALGPLLEPLGAVLGLSWGLLGPLGEALGSSWGALVASWGAHRAPIPGRRKKKHRVLS